MATTPLSYFHFNCCEIAIEGHGTQGKFYTGEPLC